MTRSSRLSQSFGVWNKLFGDLQLSLRYVGYWHFVLKSIWNFYEVEFYYSDTGFLPFGWCFWLKRHLAFQVKIQNYPFLLGQNSKFTPFSWVKITPFCWDNNQNSPRFIGSIFRIHPFLLGQIQNSSLVIGSNSKFTPFYWVKFKIHPFLLGQYSKSPPFLGQRGH